MRKGEDGNTTGKTRIGWAVNVNAATTARRPILGWYLSMYTMWHCL
jgi:hypothetical protein